MRFQLLLLILVTLAACNREQTAATGPAYQSETANATAPDTAAARFDPNAAQATTPGSAIALLQKDVQVTLSDQAIEMPAALTAGKITFNVTNAGTREHSFEIEGAGRMDRTLQPGQSGQLTADLQPGSWEVYCPVADHEGRGMRRTLVVR